MCVLILVVRASIVCYVYLYMFTQPSYFAEIYFNLIK